jgi:cytochrome c peroxidase
MRRASIALLALSTLTFGVAAAVGACSSSSNAPGPTCDLDDAFDAKTCATLHALALPADLPPAHGNAKADDLQAATLGFAIFFDARFSKNQEIRCATCHLPEHDFGDGETVSIGLAAVTRNSPTALEAAHMTTFFWDGRADSLWSQPLFAFENANEMDFTRLEIAHRVARSYATQYQAVFGPLPPLAEGTRFPPRGKPGDAAWAAMTEADRAAIDRVAANVGKALEAYLRKLASGPSPFDRFLAGDASALDAPQRRGLVSFVRNGCLDCHSGSAFSDMQFHNLGVPAWPGIEPDRGRAEGLQVLRDNPFNGAGPFYDGEKVAVPSASSVDLGAFRTPTLRNVAISAPYAHNGRYATLSDVVSFHLQGGGAGGAGFVGTVDDKLTKRTVPPNELADLVAFLQSLTGRYPAQPWGGWPEK